MTQFRRAKPNQELRNLKEWGPGRHSQLRLFVAHLEDAFNNSLAAQVSQSSKRKFSQFVPKIVTQDIASEVEYREIRLAWEPPRGLRNFLFYELQISLTDNFSNFDGFITSDPFFVFPNLLDGRVYYTRIRVVTKDGLFGPWSDNIESTLPFSQAYGFVDGSEFIVPVYNSESFQNIFLIDYEAIGGTVYYSIDYEVEIRISGSSTKNVEWADIEFQWVVDDEQIGQNFLVTTYGTNDTASSLTSDLEAKTADIGDFSTGDSLLLPGPFKLARRGTFVQKFSTIAQGTRTIELKARAVNWHPTPNDWEFNTGDSISDVLYGQSAMITTKNFTIFEVLTS